MLNYQSFHGVPFIESPYEKGCSLREDVFFKQFRIVVEGESAFEEDEPMYGYYYVDSSADGGCSGLLLEALQKSEKMVKENIYLGGEDDDAVEDYRASTFNPHRVLVFDRYKKFVIGGIIVSDSTINWVRPIFDSVGRVLITKYCDQLLTEASFEAGWDNFCTAKQLRSHSRDLSLHIPKTRYQFTQELVNVVTVDLWKSSVKETA